MLSQIWDFIVHNALLIGVALFFFVRMFVRFGTIPMPEHPGSKVTDVKTPEEWNGALSKAKEEKKLVVVDFYATWCGPCRRASPIFGKMSVGKKRIV
ncbi:thioredoxin [archaeon]|nr:MAG: thioredoxin [archaeon]